MTVMTTTDKSQNASDFICGVVFSRSIRASLVFFHLALIDDADDDDDVDVEEGDNNNNDEGIVDSDDDPLRVAIAIMDFSIPPTQKQEQDTVCKPVVRDNQSATILQPQKQQANYRSMFRKCCHYGDLVVVKGGKWIHGNEQEEGHDGSLPFDNLKLRYLIKVPILPYSTSPSPSGASQLGNDGIIQDFFQIKRTKQWTMQQCQQAAFCWQNQRSLMGKNKSFQEQSSISSKIPSPRKLSSSTSTFDLRPSRQRQQQTRQRHHSPCPLYIQRSTFKSNVDHKDVDEDDVLNHRGTVAVKRTQGEYLASFLIHMIEYKHQQNHFYNDTNMNIAPSSSSWFTAPLHPNRLGAIAKLNEGTGVLDVAGGSGHVSMALGLFGIQSTVVDPRPHLGMLPRRDRKIYAKHRWRRLNQQHTPCDTDNDQSRRPSNATDESGDFTTNEDKDLQDPQQYQNCDGPSVVEFRTYRAWFGTTPPGKEWNRHLECQQICSIDHELVQNCSAVVALHPDEATEAIVDVAVRLRTPFCIVPCCVFARLFPHRRLGSCGRSVCTYQDFLDYLQEKDESIQRCVLPFAGANTILWSTF